MSGVTSGEHSGWVPVDFNGIGSRTERMAVPGGWLYRTMLWSSSGVDVAAAMVFVPSPIQGPATVQLSADDIHAMSRRK
jgi:hypothetical protein